MAAKTKPPCKYGAKCYRKNAQHLQTYSHPRDEEEEDEEMVIPRKKPRRNSNDSDEEVAQLKKQDSGEGKGKKTLDDFFVKKKAKDLDDNGDNKKAAEDESAETSTPSGTDNSATEDVDKDDSEDENSDVEEDIEPPPSPDDVKENIKQKYLMEMPDDFYEFWEFCQKLNPKKPQEALKEGLGFRLVGPYDILRGRHKGITKNKLGRRPNYLLHYRYYYDPPEFMTIISGDRNKQYHLGYFRDSPNEMPIFVAANSAADSCSIIPKGDNLFAAIKNCIDESLKTKGLDAGKKKSLSTLQESITEWAKEKNFSLDLKSKEMKERDKKVVCKSFHGAGIVVPVDDNEVGYRPVPESPAELKKMFKKVVESKTDEERDKHMDEVQELITLVQFANDECDYGEGLELGMDLFCYGGNVLHGLISHLLPLAYQLLRRVEFEKIIKAHLKYRSKTINDELEV